MNGIAFGWAMRGNTNLCYFQLGENVNCARWCLIVGKPTKKSTKYFVTPDFARNMFISQAAYGKPFIIDSSMFEEEE